MADPESDVYHLLKLNGLNLAPHLITILKDLGYNDLRSLIELLDHEEIEVAVKESFSEDGVEASYKELSPEDQKKAYGPRYFRNPKNFKLQPGEKASLAAISPLCKIDKCGKSISSYIDEWVKKKESEVEYGIDDYVLKSSKLVCLKCHCSYSFTLSVLGYWKAERFVAHVLEKHRVKSSGNIMKTFL